MYCTSPIPLRTATGYDFEHFYCSSYVFNCFLTTVYKSNCPTIENHKISPKTTPEHLYCSKDPFFLKFIVPYYRPLLPFIFATITNIILAHILYATTGFLFFIRCTSGYNIYPTTYATLTDEETSKL